MLDNQNLFEMTLQESNTRIIELLAEGKTYKEIGAVLNMKYRTIVDRVEEMKKKNACLTRDQLLLKMLNPVFGRMMPGR